MQKTQMSEKGVAAPRRLSAVLPQVAVAAALAPLLLLLLTHPLQQAWGASGRFWQRQYDKVLLAGSHDFQNLFVFGTVLVGYLMYWVPGGLYTLLDLFLVPNAVRQYKVQPGTNEPVGTWPLVKCLLVVHFNHIVLGVPFLWGCYHAFVYRGGDLSPLLPSLPRVLFDVVVSMALKEFVFYYVHRLIHHRLLYKHIHKPHHEWQSPIAVMADYGHPLEHIFGNMAPVVLGPLLLRSHLVTIWLLQSLASLGTIINHSGYHLPFFPSPEFHDFHHLKFTECYGHLGFMDYLHGTDRKFRQSINFLRHKTLCSLQPLTQTYPEDRPRSTYNATNNVKQH